MFQVPLGSLLIPKFSAEGGHGLGESTLVFDL